MAPPRNDPDDITIFLAECRPGVSRTAAMRALGRMRVIGKALHTIYERQCNGHQTWDGRWDETAAKRDERREERLESELRALFEGFGLGLYLNGDPRGNPVGILTPKTGRFNTMGGAEAGWRL